MLSTTVGPGTSPTVFTVLVAHSRTVSLSLGAETALRDRSSARERRLRRMPAVLGAGGHQAVRRRALAFD